MAAAGSTWVLMSHREAVERLHEAGDHFVGARGVAGVDHQAVLGLVDPHRHARAAGEGHGQQLEGDVFLELLLFLLAGLAAGGGLDVGAALVDLAANHRAGHLLAFDHVFDQPLAVDGLHQRAVGLAARLDPAGGLFLRGAAGLEALPAQAFFRLGQCLGPGGFDAIDDDVLEYGHGNPFSNGLDSRPLSGRPFGPAP